MTWHLTEIPASGWQLFSRRNYYLLEDEVSVTATDTLDGAHGEHDVPLSVDVGVHHTEDVLEVGGDDQRHLGGSLGNEPATYKWQCFD